MKRIIELSENDYKALKEDGVQNHLALANTIIAHSVPYEPQKEIVPVCKVTFDKEQLQEIVDKKVAELVADNKRQQGEWGKWIVAEIQCPNCFKYFEVDDYSSEKLNKCPHCGQDMRGEEE